MLSWWESAQHWTTGGGITENAIGPSREMPLECAQMPQDARERLGRTRNSSKWQEALRNAFKRKIGRFGWEQISGSLFPFWNYANSPAIVSHVLLNFCSHGIALSIPWP